jgi:3-hydroxyacyl-CoA dehydrogenase/enoyl-CoA hydratase/3-hydroxybutyryl-CoA epimerase
MTNFKLAIDGDGIALLTWDVPDRSMNVITLQGIEELSAIVEQLTADAAVKGVVITSAKEAFCAGADLTLLESLGRTFATLVREEGEEQAAVRLFEESRRLSLLYRRIETCGKPWVAAINGTAVGGGFELALACHYRVAAQNPKTRVGLPEIKVGLFPGAGGTIRISRMLAPADALQFLLKGDQLRVERAKAMKLIDAVVPPDELITTAKDWIKAGGKAKNPWDVDGFRLPGGLVYSKAGMMTFPAANAIYRRETYDNYPAARAILQVVYEGLQLPMDLALRVESRWFAKILRSPEAAAMMRSLFVSMQDLNKGARRPAAIPPSKFKRIGIIGAGFMGAGIGYVTAQAGIGVVLVDRDQESADKGKAQSHKLITEQVNKGRATAADRDALMSRIAATADCLAGLRSRHRGGVRGSRREGRDLRQGAGRHGRPGDIRFQHLDAADHVAGAGVQRSDALHRNSLFFAGGADDAGRNHPWPGHRRCPAGGRARLCPGHPQNPDRGQRFPRILYLARGRHLYPRRPPDADRRRAGRDDRECRPHGRHAGRPAVAQ